MRPLLAIFVGLLMLAGPVGSPLMPVAAADDQLADRPVSSIQLQGLKRVSEQKALNNIRSRVGQAYDPETARNDVNRLTRLGDFGSIDVIAELQNDGTVALRYLFQEEELLAEVSVVGNRMLDDSALLAKTGLHRGSPRDDFLIQRGIRLMEDMYKGKGFYLVEITVDEKQLGSDGVLIYEVIEGPRVRIRAIEFVGAESFRGRKLRSQIETSTWFPLLERAALDNDQLVKDVAKLTSFYRDQGWIDVRVDRSIEISPNQREAKVTFLIEEGERYSVGVIKSQTIDGEPTKVLTEGQISALMTIKVGDAFRADLMRRSIDAIRDAYGVMGYLDSEVRSVPIRRSDDSTELDLLVQVKEGKIADVGLLNITGNTLTQDRVIRGMTRLNPGHRFDGREIKRTEERIKRSGLFSEAKVRLQRPDPTQPDQRDVLIEVKEKNTGSVNFGVGIGSDSGVLGNISLTQNNFDVMDPPQTWGEMAAGRAFRGAGQQFSMNFQPGTEIFAYDISLTEPRFLDTPISLGGTAGYYRRIYEEYTEQRLYTGATVSRRLGDIWFGDFRLEYTNVSLTQIADDAPDQVRDSQGPDNLVSVGGTLIRTTLDTFTRPTAGSRTSISYSNFGAFAGDVAFNRTRMDYTTYFLLDRDFLDRPSTLRLDAGFGLIFGGDAPNYEKFYMGGRALRGFRYRGIGPRGTIGGVETDTVVGGDFMCTLGAQYQFPLVGKMLDGVVFVDSGTVNSTATVTPYRASVGIGFRVYIAALGSTPLGFDFAIPILSQDEDETQVFSFAADLPF
jgi:outer membrane protein insertion porin family